MSKNHIFYDKYAGLKRKLFLVFLVTAFVSFGAGLGILKISNLKSIGMGLETVYKDRVRPLKQLKMLSEIYGINVVDTVNKVNNHIISWNEGRKNLNDATKKIPNLWSEYLQTYIVDEEREIVDKLQVLFKSAETALIKLNEIFLKEDHDALTKFIKQDLYQSIEPVTTKIDELFQTQVRIVENIHKYEQKRYRLSLNIGIGSIVMSIILCIIVVLQWRRFRALLDFL